MRTGVPPISPNPPADPMDRTEPKEPIDSKDPAEPIESAEANDPIDAKDRPLRTERADPPLTAEPALKRDARDPTEKSDHRDRRLVASNRPGREVANADMMTSVVLCLTLSSITSMTTALDTVKCGREDRSVTESSVRSARQPLLDAARAELADRGQAAVSLRAVARRAGVSHAAPSHFFGDRSGLLTAVAIDGFDDLAAHLEAVASAEPATKVAALGRTYVDFGWNHPALMELMFRGAELHGDDPSLHAARHRAISPLVSAIAQTGVADVRDVTLISWALVHGLVVLSREGVIAPLMGPGADDRTVAAALIDRYVARILSLPTA